MGKNLYSLISYASMASSIPTLLWDTDKSKSFGRVNLGHVLLASVCMRTFCELVLGFSWERKSMEKFGLRAHGAAESIW